MDCLEFRRIALADPRRPGRAAAAHAEECRRCREFLFRTLEEEAALAAALRVPVPEGLAARMLYRPSAVRRWLVSAALAASLLVAAGIAFLVSAPSSDPLALASIEFVVYEEAQTIADARPTDWNALARVASEMGVALPQQLGTMRYICVYPLAGKAAHHLLVSTPLGKLTVLLVPEQPLAARTAASAHGLEAALLPAGKGAVAIVGASARSVARAERLLRSG
jgi:hypothetical protein